MGRTFKTPPTLLQYKPIKKYRIMKATELGRAIKVIEKARGISESDRCEFNKIASDRWALVMMYNGKATTLATGKDVMEALKKYFNCF